MQRFSLDSHENALGSMRAQIRQAGSEVGQVSSACFGAAGAILLGGASFLFRVWLTSYPDVPLRAFVTYPLAMSAFLVILGIAIVGIERAVRRGRLRRQLRAMPRDDHERVLLPLRREAGDAREIVAPLLGEFRIGSEVVPSAPPMRRRDEVAPAERPLLEIRR